MLSSVLDQLTRVILQYRYCVCCCGQAKDAKACLRLDSVNITVVPEKVGNPNGMQINYEHENRVRNLFIYAETPQVT